MLLLTGVDKPALLRRLFELACRYCGQALSYTRMPGQLHDAGNATTLAYYLDLLGGAHLANAEAGGELELYYWRERNQEVDFVVKAGRRLAAIEVKSGRAPLAHRGTAAFAAAFRPQRSLLVGGDGLELGEFLSRQASHWISG